MARIGDFASAAPPIGPDTPGADVFDRFQNEPDTLVIAMVDENRRPVGLIERNAFTLKMAAEYGRALYARRPASTFMDPPRMLDSDADAELLFQSVDAANLGALLNGFVVTSKGRYVGVGAGIHVLQAGSSIHRRRADAMSDLTRDLARAEAEARASSRTIRGLTGEAARIPILALTANADPRDEVEYLAAGMDGVAQKPIQPDVLVNAIRRVLSRDMTAIHRAA
ncbi:hypothetical protein [Brevundimonas sp.]|uniref:hypothetical protein n=1 Tax=Brevundimonas sp. TaxID=1871086 RepID=UPI00356AEB76